MTVDIPVGNTLPDMLTVIIICVIADKIIPAEKSGEYFGILDICGKGAAFFGTFLVSFISQLTGRVNTGVGSLAVMFLLGLLLFRKAVKLNEKNIVR